MMERAINDCAQSAMAYTSTNDAVDYSHKRCAGDSS